MNINKQKIIVNHKENTNLYINAGVFEKLGEILSAYKYTSFTIVCDETTKNLFCNKLEKILTVFKSPVFTIVLEQGEKSKNIKTVINISESMLLNGVDRKSAVIALGGGVIGDIVTMVSGLYYRGVDSIQIPTTLLAQIDSAIGGKGAVNLSQHKNTIGIIKQPKIIIIDPMLLVNLPQKQINSGMAEIIKYAISLDSNLFEKLEEAEKLDRELLNFIIKKSIELKINIIKKDPLDVTGKRAVLNFGHTIGQAIELLSNLSHGEAVSVGMAFAVKVSQKMKFIKETDANRALKLIIKYKLPVNVKSVEKKKILDQILNDKKTISKIPQFVLIKKIGQAVTRQIVAENTIKEVLNEIVL